MLSLSGLNQSALLQLLESSLHKKRYKHIEFALQELQYIPDSADDAWNTVILFCMLYIFHQKQYVHYMSEFIQYNEWFMTDECDTKYSINKTDQLCALCKQIIGLEYKRFECEDFHDETLNEDEVWSNYTSKYSIHLQEFHEHLRYTIQVPKSHMFSLVRYFNMINV